MLLKRPDAFELPLLQSSSDSLFIKGSVALFSPIVFSLEFIYVSPLKVILLVMGVGMCWEPSKVTMG